MGFQENLIVDRLFRLGLSKQQLSTLAGIRTQILIPGLRGVVNLSGKDLEKIYQVLDGIQELRKLAAPFVLPTDVQQLRYLLDQQRLGRFDVTKPAAWEQIAAEVIGV